LTRKFILGLRVYPIYRIFQSGSYIKVIGWRSRSQEHMWS